MGLFSDTRCLLWFTEMWGLMEGGERQRRCENRWRQTCAEGWQFDGILALFHEIRVAADAAKLPTAVQIFCDLSLQGLAGLTHTHTHAHEALSFACACACYIYICVCVCVCVCETEQWLCFCFRSGKVVCQRWISRIRALCAPELLYCSDREIGCVCGNF